MAPRTTSQTLTKAKDVWRVIQLIARERKRKELEPVLATLDDCLERTRGLRDAEARAFRKQLKELQRFAQLGDRVLDRIGSRKSSAILSWVRFEKAGFSHAEAVRNSRALFQAAKAAGVERVVHVSITNPSLHSRYTYFRGKAQVEEVLRETGLSHAILRPAVLFGGPDILLNNIAWMLRRFPLFGIVGGGRYRLQPIHVRDLAALALEVGAQHENVTLDAIGPETYSYRDLVKVIGTAIGHPRRLVPTPKWLALTLTTMLGWIVRDIVLTQAEIDALMDDLLVTTSPPTAPTRLSAWLETRGEALGRRYASELTRRRERARAYVPRA